MNLEREPDLSGRLNRADSRTVRRLESVAIFASLFLVTSTNANAGAWVPKRGTGYHKLAFNHFTARNFSGAPSANSVGEFRNSNLTYYGEVGLGEWGKLPPLALFTTFAFQSVEQETNDQVFFDIGFGPPFPIPGRFEENETDFLGVGDVDLGLRVGLFEGPVVVSGQFLAKLPFLYDENTELPPGNGQLDFEPRLLFGKSFGKWGYAGLELGYRFRLDEPSDEARILAEYGVSLPWNLYFRTKLDINKSIENGDSPDFAATTVGLNAANPNQFDLIRQEVTLGYTLDKWKLGTGDGQLGFEFTWAPDLYASDALRGNTFQFGITFVHN